MLDKNVSQFRIIVEKGSDVGVVYNLPPPDAFHNGIKPVLSQDRWDVLDNPKDVVGSDPDSPLEFRQLFQWSTVLQLVRPSGP